MTIALTGSRWRRTLIVVLAIAGAAEAVGCGGASTEPPNEITSIDVSLKPELEIGQIDTASAVARDESGAPVAASIVSWSSTFPDVAEITPEGEIHTKSIGTTEIVATVAGKSGRMQVTVVAPPLLINEINPDGDRTGGWIEIFNSTSHAIDIGGWFIVTIIGPGHVEVYSFPHGSVIAAGEFVVVDETMIPGLLNANGTVALFSRYAAAADVLSWTSNTPGIAFARCPDGNRLGSLVSTTTPTRKGPNVCTP